MTAALEGGEWSAVRPDRTLPPGKTRYPLYRRLGGHQGRSGRAENLVPTGIRSRTVQPVVSRYTDWATGPSFSDVLLVFYSTVLPCRAKMCYKRREVFEKFRPKNGYTQIKGVKVSAKRKREYQDNLKRQQKNEQDKPEVRCQGYCLA